MIIRDLDPNDVAEVLSIYAYYVANTSISFEYETPDFESFKLKCFDIKSKYGFLVGVEKGEIVGYAYANRFRERKAYDFIAETSIYVKNGQFNRGLGKQLYLALFCKMKVKGINELVGVITLPNDASIDFHKKLGFYEAGIIRNAGLKFDKLWDIGIWQKSL